MEFISQVWSLLTVIVPYALPFILLIVLWEMWLDYVRTRFYQSNPKILLEVKLPQEILKSPLAMEVVLSVLYQTGREGTFIDRYIKGQRRAFFSLEMASFGGQVHFFIWTEAGYKNLIEAQIYAQYPGVEISEAPDYARGIMYQPGVNQLWGCEFVKTSADPLPIKTYVDFGMDKDPDEEVKIDPMTAMIEFLGSVKEGQQVWFQIIMKAHKAEKKVFDAKKGINKKVDWKHFAIEEKNKILKNLKDDKDTPGRRLTRGEEQIITAIERNVSKLPFDVGMRVIYFAETKDKFNRTMINGITGLLRHYNANNLNGFRPDRTTSFDYPWQDFNGHQLDKKKSKMIKAFKKRSFFTMKSRKPYVMSSEEIATIYHFPGSVVSTPTFSRIMSKKSEAPANLPL